MLRKGELSLLGEKKGRILHRKGLVNYNHLQLQLGMLEQEKRKAEFQLSRRHSVAGVPSYIGRSERSKIHEIDGHLATKDASVTKRRESLDPAMLAAMLDVDSSTVELDAQVYARVRLPPMVVRKSLEIIDGEEHNQGKTVATVTRQRRVSVACPNWTVKTNGRRLPPVTSRRTTDDKSDVNGGTLTLPAITITHPQPTVHSQSDKQGRASSTDSCLGLGTKSKPRKSSITFAERNILKEDND
uniref:Uncharacterized protein n=1 Tax=Branchiostoma floridae TaxID=7739 RepID=C3Z442_BRAFL|eukprot:XP_002596643.1 hypothetical protein BRAFLDRAFT_78462 [Branchiostoma floridae]